MQNLWVFSFEYAGIIKVGGLGEVPANQTKWLADQYNITLFIPSHGVHKESAIREKLKLHKLDYECTTTINALNLQLGDTIESIHIEYYIGHLNGINVIILAGKNEFSSRILNDPTVYSPDSLSGKFVLFSLGMKHYIKSLLHENPMKVPDLIHCHDHHGVPAMICCRQELLKQERDVATILTVHLLTWPRKNSDFLIACGIEEIPFDVFIGGEHKTFNFSEFYRFCKGSEFFEPTLEKIGVYFADLVTSVSEDYALSNVVGNLGGGWIYPKIDYIWNGCDWEYDSLLNSVKNSYETGLKALGSKNWYSRSTFRRFLLTRGFSYLQDFEPVIDSKKVQKALEDLLTFFPYMKDSDGVCRGKIANFYEDGPLVITTGRISKQKGIDVLLDAVPMILKVHPDTKFILSVLPTEFAIPDLEYYLERIKLFTDNVRMIFGKVFSLFFLMHLAADVYCAPSRWEPFGIMALEAMVAKVPVVASQTGGLQEIVVDIGKEKLRGTGLLVRMEEPVLLADAVSDVISIVKIGEQTKYGSFNNQDRISSLKKFIKHPVLQEIIEFYPNLATLIRNNAIKRVEENFRWNQVTQKLPKLYNQALKNRGSMK
ncbi:MAG: glycosyltransferase [Candidatus Lokiarchaeota archaeon]|nr:glycosyltransferase [Candidatus Lokiarchaeota archaeon]